MSPSEIWSRLFRSPVDWTAFAVAVLAASVLALVAAWLIRRATLSTLARVASHSVDTTASIVTVPLRVVSVAAFSVVFQLMVFPALELVGLAPRGPRRLGPMATWILGSGVKILVLVVVAYTIAHAVALLVRRFERDVGKGTTLDALERAKRARTLGTVVTKAVTSLLAGVALLMILKECGLDITPALTGAGIAGLAVGFGAQTLVRDVLSGFFLILEDQIRVGDVALINGIEGVIEELNLRTIVLRDGDGTVHVVPNGAITRLANRSRSYLYSTIELRISYHEDPDRVADILRDTDSELRRDPGFAPFMLAPIEILGVDGFTDWAITIKSRLKTVPAKQADIGREFRKRLNKALHAHGIEIPLPEQIITVRAAASDVVKQGV